MTLFSLDTATTALSARISLSFVGGGRWMRVTPALQPSQPVNGVRHQSAVVSEEQDSTLRSTASMTLRQLIIAADAGRRQDHYSFRSNTSSCC